MNGRCTFTYKAGARTMRTHRLWKTLWTAGRARRINLREWGVIEFPAVRSTGPVHSAGTAPPVARTPAVDAITAVSWADSCYPQIHGPYRHYVFIFA